MNRATLVATAVVAFLIGTIIREVASSQLAVLPDGGEFRGQLLDGRLHGEGEIHWRNGRHYQGEFVDGLYHGRGLMQHGEGNRYEGQFVNGKAEGQGTLRFHNGDLYVGEFHQDRMHGHGRYVRDGNVYEGEFVNDEFTGQGTFTSGGTLQYSGGFREWNFHGEGQFFTPSGDSWKGTFENGSITGKGEHIDSDGNRYVGELEYWAYQGSGVHYLQDGSRYEGEFQYGEYHGKGAMHLPEPEHGVTGYTGEWRNGQLVKADVDAFVPRTDEKIEAALYSEAALLDAQLTALQAGTPGVAELYFIGVAGDGSQRVFGREIDFVSSQLQQQYELEGRSVTLINDRDRIGVASMATRTSIEKAVQAVAAKMNSDEDVLLLYITSHGSREHAFMLHQNGLQLPDLEAEALARILEESGIKWQLLMVSACFSGGFLPLLQGPQRLVMTSAAADRSSFGCSDDSDMTYFGKALFREAFTQQSEWVRRFEVARDWIEQKEKAEDMKQSLPQIAVGKDIENKLLQLQRKNL